MPDPRPGLRPRHVILGCLQQAAGAQQIVRRVQQLRLWGPAPALQGRDQVLAVPQPVSELLLRPAGPLPQQLQLFAHRPVQIRRAVHVFRRIGAALSAPLMSTVRHDHNRPTRLPARPVTSAIPDRQPNVPVRAPSAPMADLVSVGASGHALSHEVGNPCAPTRRPRSSLQPAARFRPARRPPRTRARRPTAHRLGLGKGQRNGDIRGKRLPAPAPDPQPSDEYGRGLLLVEMPGDAVGVAPRLPSGKTVWLRFRNGDACPVGRVGRAFRAPKGQVPELGSPVGGFESCGFASP